MAYSHQPQMSHYVGGNMPMAATNMNSKPSFSLKIMQEPIHAKAAGGKEKDRKPLDPPPVLELVINRENFDYQKYGNPDYILENPYMFVGAQLENVETRQEVDCVKALYGEKTGSLQRVKFKDRLDFGAYFVFPDLSVKKEGFFRLIFTAYELNSDDGAQVVAEVRSSTFQVHGSKGFPGMQQSTQLTKELSENGIRVRIRKDSRSVLKRKQLFQRAFESDIMRRTQSMASVDEQDEQDEQDKQNKRARYESSSGQLPSPPQAPPQMQSHNGFAMGMYQNYASQSYPHPGFDALPPTPTSLPSYTQPDPSTETQWVLQADVSEDTLQQTMSDLF